MDHLVKAYQRSIAQKAWMINKSKESHQDLNAVKPNEKWSINQLLFHLYTVEKSILDYITYKNALNELTQPAGLKAKLRYFTLKTLLKTKMKFKAPKKISVLPENIDFEQLTQDWSTLQTDFESFLSQFPKELVGKGVFRHPYAGFLSMEQTIEFIVDHSKHHQSQLNRLV